MSDEQLWAVAVHEAAHCVAAFLRGVDIDRAELLQDGGRMLPVAWWPDDERRLIVRLAGPAATQELAPHPRLTYEDDLEDALQAAGALAGRAGPFRARRAAIEAQALVRAHADAIQKIASALLTTHQLTGAQIGALLEQE
jgi:hypothetical protein